MAVPEVLGVDEQCLLLAWVEPGKAGPEAAESFGRALAVTHAAGAPSFGAEDDGFVGVRGVCGFDDVPKCVCLLIISTGVSAVSPNSAARGEVSGSYSRVSFGGFRSKKGSCQIMGRKDKRAEKDKRLRQPSYALHLGR